MSSCNGGKCVVEKPVNPKCGLRVECVGNRHDNRLLMHAKQANINND